METLVAGNFIGVDADDRRSDEDSRGSVETGALKGRGKGNMKVTLIESLGRYETTHLNSVHALQGTNLSTKNKN